MLPLKLQPGNRVRMVSPASTPTIESVEGARKLLETLGLKVEIGDHALDKWGYMAGKDEDRLNDFNNALRDPGIKAIIATTGGKGAYRIADRLDFEAARQNCPLIIGFSEITILHLTLYKHAQLPGIHGAPWGARMFGEKTAASFRHTIMSAETVIVQSKTDEPTSVLTTGGIAEGVLLGGNQDMVAISSGWAQPSFKDAILLLEAYGMPLGHIDRQLTMLKNIGALDHIRGIAIGQYIDCGSNNAPHGWTYLDVLRDRLHRLNVPILGGLPIGHGANPIAIPIGTKAVIDADKGLLMIAAAVQ